MKRIVLTASVIGGLYFLTVAAPSFYKEVPKESTLIDSIKPKDDIALRYLEDSKLEGVHPDKGAPERDEEGAWWKSPVTGIVYCQGVPAGEAHVFDGGDPTEYVSIANGDKAGAANNPASACTSNMTDMSLMPWPDKANFNEPLNHWDLSNVISMRSMFNRAQSFNQPVNLWDTSQAEDMSMMFSGASNFNQSVNKWNTSKVKTMRALFQSASRFNQPLDKWDTSQVEDMSFMFNGFDNAAASGENFSTFNQPLNQWDTQNVRSMRAMFQSATLFNQSLDNWDVSSVVRMDAMFYGALSFNQPLNSWDVSSVTKMDEMFKGTPFNQNLSSWCASRISSKPSSFDSNTPDWVKADRQPVWGACPSAL